MAVRIPIITVFDSKGLRQAQYQLNKVRDNFQNLGRNFAVAGAAIAGVSVVIGKAVQEAARAQQILTQTESVLRSTGTTANGTAKDIQNLSSRLMSLTAVEDETIQSGANLLLTFKNIQNQAGEGNDIFNQTVAAMLDVSRAMGTDVNGEAIRLGKALNDPIRGIAALTRVGIQFTEQQRNQIKALVQSGDLMSAQKIILAELQSQFGGSAQAFAQTFAGQLEILNGELGNLSEEIGIIVMPALRELVSAFRELAPEAGAKLREALGAVDWAAFAQTIANTVTFFIQNAEAILKLVGTLFALNTAFNLIKVTAGLVNVATTILGNTFTITAGKIGLATGAVKLFRTALVTTGIGALVVGLGFVIEAIINTSTAATNGRPQIGGYGEAIRKSGQDAEWAASRFGIAAVAAQNLNNATGRITTSSSYDAFEVRRAKALSEGQKAGVEAAKLAAEAKKLQSLLNGLSTSTTTGSKSGTTKGDGLSPFIMAQIAREEAAEKRAAKAEQRQRERLAEIARIEAEALAERQRVYKSFLDSVQSTFGRIKDSILGAFALPELGGTTDSIIRNMRKLINATRTFSSNITQLSSMGLNPELLQQVISAGPIAGGRLAQALVAGGAGAIAEIGAGFAEFGGLAGQIATTGTNSAFGTQAQQNIYNINVQGGLDSAPSIGRAIVDAIRAYERTSGAIWQVA